MWGSRASALKKSGPGASLDCRGMTPRRQDEKLIEWVTRAVPIECNRPRWERGCEFRQPWLASVILEPEREFSMSELGRIAGANLATSHREVERFIAMGIVLDRRVGRARVVKANPDYPLLKPLRQILDFGYGPAVVLKAAIAELDGVTEAFIYGSWAARRAGQVGAPPRDIDVILIGEPTREAMGALVRFVQPRMALPVNVQRVGGALWTAGSDPFVATIKSGAL